MTPLAQENGRGSWIPPPMLSLYGLEALDVARPLGEVLVDLRQDDFAELVVLETVLLLDEFGSGRLDLFLDLGLGFLFRPARVAAISTATPSMIVRSASGIFARPSR